MQNVTIVVPVYKDWNSLAVCLDSLKRFVDKKHRVMIMNDRGPEWQEMERNIQHCIKGYSNFYYYINDRNLGFVRTCNRAVMELDGTDNDILLLNSDTKVTDGFLEEMSEVLYLHEKHGVVCPRSSNATILTMPVKNNTGELLDEKVSYAVFAQVRHLLPRYSVIPTGVGFAFLVKRELIKTFGLFDEVYSLGYNEENDFCMRINQYGYSVVMANQAFVFHFEGRSFGKERIRLETENHRTLLNLISL